MSGPKWTPAQQAAIADRGGALLVSAAAGSGKTAVLTERAVQLITDPEHPVNADRLLIVTFTNAAAAELRARIGQALLHRSQLQPGNAMLRRQRMLLQRAPICTIDAFCLDLLHKHFQALDIPPDFAPADPGTVQLLRGAALAETLENAYRDPDFCAFADLYGKGRTDKPAGDAILQIYDFLRALPDYNRKLDEFLAPYEQENGFASTCWHDLLLAEAARCAKAARELLTAALALTLVLPGLAAYEMPIQTVNEGESVYLFNADIDKPILEQNADQQRYIASLTKMMTALLFLESGKDMNAEITIPASLTQEFKDIQNANGSTINLRIGETVRRIDLLYGLLVASANDAASVIASDVSDGDLTAFVARMNQKAAELGMTGTHFCNPTGLHDPEHVSTVRDMARLTEAALQNETFRKLFTTERYTVPATNCHPQGFTMHSTLLSQLDGTELHSGRILGGKTGYTGEAGLCLASLAEVRGREYILVTAGAGGDHSTAPYHIEDAVTVYRRVSRGS